MYTDTLSENTQTNSLKKIINHSQAVCSSKLSRGHISISVSLSLTFSETLKATESWQELRPDDTIIPYSVLTKPGRLDHRIYQERHTLTEGKRKCCPISLLFKSLLHSTILIVYVQFITIFTELLFQYPDWGSEDRGCRMLYIRQPDYKAPRSKFVLLSYVEILDFT